MSDQTFKCLNCGAEGQDPNGDCIVCSYPNGEINALVALSNSVSNLQAEFGDISGWQALLTDGQVYPQAAADLAAARADVSRLQGELVSVEGNVTTLTNQLSVVNGNVTDLTTQLTNARNEATGLQAEVANGITIKNKLQDELAALIKERDEVSRLLSGADGHNQRLISELAKVNGDLDATRAGVAQLQGDLVDATSLNTDLTVRLAYAVKAHDEKAQLIDVISAAFSKLDILKDVIAQMPAQPTTQAPVSDPTSQVPAVSTVVTTTSQPDQAAVSAPATPAPVQAVPVQPTSQVAMPGASTAQPAVAPAKKGSFDGLKKFLGSAPSAKKP